MASDLEGRRFKTNIDQSRMRWLVVPSTTVTLNQIVVCNGFTGAYMTVELASAVRSTHASEPLYITRHISPVPANGLPVLEVVQQAVIRMATGVHEVWDPIFLGLDGAFTFNPPDGAYHRVVGHVAGQAAFFFDGRLTGPVQSPEDSLVVAGQVMTAVQNPTVTVGAGFNGLPVVAMLGAADGTNAVRSASIVGGVLTIRLAAVPAVATPLNYFIYTV